MPSHLKRYQTEGHYHFITFSCYRRLPYLDSDRTRILFEETLEKLRRRHNFFLFGYVLMPEHVHLLLSEPTVHSLGTTMSVLKGETSKLLKGDRPQFWQNRYYDSNVFTQDKFVEKIEYIHNNPVTRGLVDKPEDWPWCSSRHWSTGELGRIEIESHWTWTHRERVSFPPIAIKPR
jgi:putative transposase